MTYELIHGDARHVSQHLEPNSVDLIITGERFIGGDRAGRYDSARRIRNRALGGHCFVTDVPAVDGDGPLFPGTPAVYRCVFCQAVTCDIAAVTATHCRNLRMLEVTT